MNLFVLGYLAIGTAVMASVPIIEQFNPITAIIDDPIEGLAALATVVAWPYILVSEFL